MKIRLTLSESAEPLGELKAMLIANGVAGEVVEAILSAIRGANTTSNTSAKVYANHMLLSYTEYGLEGVASQVMYLLLNLKSWTGEEARQVKKLLNTWVKTRLKNR